MEIQSGETRRVRWGGRSRIRLTRVVELITTSSTVSLSATETSKQRFPLRFFLGKPLNLFFYLKFTSVTSCQGHAPPVNNLSEQRAISVAGLAGVTNVYFSLICSDAAKVRRSRVIHVSIAN